MTDNDALRIPELPDELVALADRVGGEPAWQIDVALDALVIARRSGLRVTAGQIQFRGPIGICDLYWRDFELPDKAPYESWPECVDRSYKIANAWVQHWSESPWLLRDLAVSFRIDVPGRPEDLRKYMHILLYFDAETAH